MPYNVGGLFTGTNGPPLTIDIRGTSSPARASNNIVGWTAIPPTIGTVFQTAGTSGNFIGANNPNESDGFTSVQLKLKDLTFRAPDNPAITLVNASYVIEFTGEGTLVFDTMAGGTSLPPSNLPTATGKGFCFR